MLDNEMIDGYIGELEDLLDSLVDKLKQIPSMVGGLRR